MHIHSYRQFIFLCATVWSFTGCYQHRVSETNVTPIATSLQSSPEVSPTSITADQMKFWIAPEPVGCGNGTVDDGKILFLKKSSGYDLYMMNGYGCFHRLILEDVFGAPSWSVDGKMIAIGCEEEKYICILDVHATLAPCLQTATDGGQCKAFILKKLPLPVKEEAIYIYNTSWSYDGTQVAIDGRYAESRKSFTALLSLDNEGEWKILVESSGSIHSDLSPIKNELAIGGVYILSLDNGFLRRPFPGGTPAWSPNALKIAYPTNILSSDPRITSIVQYDLVEDKSQLLYEPLILGENYSPGVNLRIHDDSGGEKPILSWSPDGRYIAFVAVYRHDNDSQIFRLDTVTGEVVVLTTKLEAIEGEQDYFAPAWGP